MWSCENFLYSFKAGLRPVEEPTPCGARGPRFAAVRALPVRVLLVPMTLDELRHTSRAAIICDMDGTLVDVRGIRHLVAPGSRRDFDAFHSASIDCPINDAVRDLLLLEKERGAKVIIVTARAERWAFLTSLWLSEHGIDADELIMRQALDYRPDHEVKTEFARALAQRYDVIAAVDDRDDIIAVWQGFGFPTIKVSEDGQLAPIVGGRAVNQYDTHP